MSITTFNNPTGEVRIREGSKFQQIPNLVEAAELLADGMFVYLGAAGKYYRASQTEPATHFVLKSGEPRITSTEITDLIGTVQIGEPVMAMTGGPGTVTIPFAGTVSIGDELMVNANGYAVRRTNGQAAYVIGVANESITVTSGTVSGEALITLPAQYRAA
jgi:hypothetical protein